MKLRDLLAALNKAPVEALDQEVLFSDDTTPGRGCIPFHCVEAVKFKMLDGGIEPWKVVLVGLDLFDKNQLPAEDERRVYLSDVREFQRKLSRGD